MNKMALAPLASYEWQLLWFRRERDRILTKTWRGLQSA
jgi:hypothetical protein